MTSGEKLTEQDRKDQRFIVSVVILHALLTRPGAYHMDVLVSDCFTLADLMMAKAGV